MSIQDHTHKLAELMLDFAFNTIRGFESGLYRRMKDEVQNDFVKLMQINVCVKYFNNAYSSLILEDDPYIIEKFGEMHSELSHSYICLLNIVFALTTGLIQQLDRSKLNPLSYSDYMKSVEIQIKSCDIYTPSHLEQFLSHKCEGMDIKTCDPNEPMFFIK